MGIRNMFRRKNKAAKEGKKSTKKVLEEDKLPTDEPTAEKVSAEPTEEPIAEERDDTTLETDDEQPTTDGEEEKSKSVEETSPDKSKFGCCEPEVFQNLSAAVGLTSSSA